jgi:predicted molibdopterin-dependent oxidoreductase YjgC
MMRFGGVDNEGSTITIQVDGEPIPAYSGDTVASALYAIGRRAWHRTRYGDERGMLCGIGYCFDCLVTVDGRPDQRACQTLVIEGMVVTTDLKQADE